MSVVDPHGGGERSSATPAGSLDSSTADGANACPRAPAPSTAAASIFSVAHATAPWPWVAFPRHRATYIPVGGAVAAIISLSLTPPRYMSGAPAASATTPEDPSTTTPGDPAAPTESPPAEPMITPEDPATKTGISENGKLGILSASSDKISDGLAKIYKKAVVIGVAATDLCNWVGYGLPKIPWFFKTHVSTWAEWSQLPGFFKGLSLVLGGAHEVFEGSAQAIGAFSGSSLLFHAVCGYIPSSSFGLPKSRKAHAVYTGGSCSQQGLHTVLSCHVIKRSYVDSVLVVQDNSGSRRSPKKVLPGVHIIRTLEELQVAIGRFKAGGPVLLIDVSEHDVHIALALQFWELLLFEGATALVKRDSNICRMSKKAYPLRDEKKRLESELSTLNKKVDDIKHSMTLVSEMLLNTKVKSGRSITFGNVDVNLPSTSRSTLEASEEEKTTSPLAS